MGKTYSNFFNRLKKINNIEYFIAILAIAIIIGLVSNWLTFQKESDVSTLEQEPVYIEQDGQNLMDIKGQENRLKQILSSIKGAGRVDVMITYKTGKELIPAMNTVESVIETEEKDSSGGIRKVSQTDINSQPVSMNTSDGTQPLITREIHPEVLGVIVIAEGAEDIHVRMELQKAVQTVLGVSANQVEIFVMEKSHERSDK
ncbi:MAG: stage III sporulation protein AG [Clostridiales bacterium]|jgi:stage III sporulation protein AG|nr:stage III sporulation protein AG [Clostridiales bacterium]